MRFGRTELACIVKFVDGKCGVCVAVNGAWGCLGAEVGQKSSESAGEEEHVWVGQSGMRVRCGPPFVSAEVWVLESGRAGVVFDGSLVGTGGQESGVLPE